MNNTYIAGNIHYVAYVLSLNWNVRAKQDVYSNIFMRMIYMIEITIIQFITTTFC